MGSGKSNAAQMEDAGCVYCPDCGTLFAMGEVLTTDADVMIRTQDCPFCAGPLEIVSPGWEPSHTNMFGIGSVATIRNVSNGATVIIMTKPVRPECTKVVTVMWEMLEDALAIVNTCPFDLENPMFRVYNTNMDAALKYHNNPDLEVTRFQEAQVRSQRGME